MNKIVALLGTGLFFLPFCQAQIVPPEPSEAPKLEALCKSIESAASSATEKWNRAHPDQVLSFQCGPAWGWKQDVSERKKIALTETERSLWRDTQAVADTAFEAESSYEDYLLSKHRITHWRLGTPPESPDPCWRYAGIVADTDYITVDPLPPNCKEGK